MGAWIEMIEAVPVRISDIVAPYMGAWIEIEENAIMMSQYEVAPYMGAWIEILICLSVVLL